MNLNSIFIRQWEDFFIVGCKRNIQTASDLLNNDQSYVLSEYRPDEYDELLDRLGSECADLVDSLDDLMILKFKIWLTWEMNNAKP